MDETQRRSVGAVVRTLREAAGLTRQEFVERTGAEAAERVGLEMLAKIEQGRKAPSARTLRKLARGLGIDSQDLSGRAAMWEAGMSAGAAPGALRSAILGHRAGVTGDAAVAGAGGVLGAAAGLVLPGSPFLFSAAGALYGRELAQRRQVVEALEKRLAEVLSRGDQDELERLSRALDQVTSTADD